MADSRSGSVSTPAVAALRDDEDGRAFTDWELPAIGVAAILGLAISLYLTVAHYDQVPLVCSVGGIVDCGSVTHSAFSQIGGTPLPISLLGITWFLVMIAIAVAPLVCPTWRTSGRATGTQLVVSGTGLAYVLYLVYVELVQLHRICEWCSAVHVLTLIIFLLALRQVQRFAER